MEPVLPADFSACFTGVLAALVEDFFRSGVEVLPDRADDLIGARTTRLVFTERPAVFFAVAAVLDEPDFDFFVLDNCAIMGPCVIRSIDGVKRERPEPAPIGETF